MARTFTKTLGTELQFSTAALASFISGQAQISLHAWVRLAGLNTGINDNRIFQTYVGPTQAGLVLAVDGTTGAVRAGGRSQPADGFQARSGTSVVTIGSYRSLGGVFNFPADTITPYFQGAAENGGAVTFGSSTYAPSLPATPSLISGDNNPVATATRTNGDIGEVAVFIGDIGASGFAHLAAGAPAIAIPGLVGYWIIPGDQDPEPDYSGNVINATVNGSLPKSTVPPPVLSAPHVAVVGL